jgi:hypothetical protein
MAVFISSGIPASGVPESLDIRAVRQGKCPQNGEFFPDNCPGYQTRSSLRSSVSCLLSPSITIVSLLGKKRLKIGG